MDVGFRRRVIDAARELGHQEGVMPTIEHAVSVCIDTIPHCDMAGVSLVEDGAIRTLAASSEVLREVDDLQFQLREGPCFDAVRHEEVVTADDLAHDSRWPHWGPELASSTGLHSSMSFRLLSTSRALGVLNLYGRPPRAFDAEDLLEGHVLSAMVALAVATSLRETQLVRALQTRTLIGQATGIVMERFGLDANTAFAVIRRLSSNHNVKINALAADLVERGVLPGEEPSGASSEPGSA